MYYASFGLLAIVIHIIINFEAARKYNADSEIPGKKQYRLFLFGLLFYYVSDVLWGFMYDTGIVALAYADTVLYFFSMGLSILLWTKFTVAYLDRQNVFSRILTYAGWGIYLFEIVTLIVNIYVPIMFAFMPDGEYIPGSARYINLGIQFILFVILAAYTTFISLRTEGQTKLHYRAISFSGIVMSIFIVLQTLDPFLPYYAIGCLIANCLVHTFVEVDDKVNRDKELGSVRKIAYKDALTNVKNANAYKEIKNYYDERIRNKEINELGIVVFDLNNLKMVNDNLGHESGDRCIRESGKLICSIYKHSPVFRIGGDEFVALLEGEDYTNREALLSVFNAQIDYNVKKGGVVVASGMAIYNPERDMGFDKVFERADIRMYDRKKALKGE
ncbi:MAG: GGDEF domain-containing protein [Lachnospiraceae bacterium]|nr:GGDEF domain-containing protein [Lachnospiraceae bacterium]